MISNWENDLVTFCGSLGTNEMALGFPGDS